MKNLQGKRAKQPPQLNSALPALTSPQHVTDSSGHQMMVCIVSTSSPAPALCSTQHHTSRLIMAPGYTLYHVLALDWVCEEVLVEDILGVGA